MGVTPRRVTYVSVQDNLPASVITGVDTWGQLKEEKPEIAAKAAGMKVLIKETQVALTSDSQNLPVGDCTIYFLLEKNKSGAGEVEAAIDEYMANIVEPALVAGQKNSEVDVYYNPNWA